jgi:hypothetical protein
MKKGSYDKQAQEAPLRPCFFPRVRCSEAELVQLRARAKECGMSVSSYMRQMVMQGKVVRKGKSGVAPELMLQLMRTGSDLQRLRESMEQRGVVVPQDLQTCLQRMDAVLPA